MDYECYNLLENCFFEITVPREYKPLSHDLMFVHKSSLFGGEYMKAQGFYDYNKKLIIDLSNYKIIGSTTEFNGDFCYLYHQGADEAGYVVVIDKNGAEVSSAFKIKDRANFIDSDYEVIIKLVLCG